MNQMEKEFYYKRISVIRRAITGIQHESFGQAYIELEGLADDLHDLLTIISDSKTDDVEEENSDEITELAIH